MTKNNLRRLIMAAMAIMMTAGVCGQRYDRIINDGWTIFPACDVSKNPQRTGVSIPHTWNTHDVFCGMDYKRTTMVYERTLNIKDPADGRRRFIKFDAVNSYAEVFVNQRRVGEHAGGYTAFSFEITEMLTAGDNKISVIASNAYRTDVAPLAGDFNIYGGITRPVHLIETAQNCISPLDYASSGVYVHQDRVSADMADLTVETILSCKDRHGGMELRTTLTDQRGNVVAQNIAPATGGQCLQHIHIDRPELWDGRGKAHLYTVRVELTADGKTVDEVEEKTGLRWFAVDKDKGFFLNGHHLDLYGPCRHEEAYQTASLYNETAMEEDADIIYEMGATGVRFVHYPHSRFDVSQYDRRGIVLWYELNLAGPGGYSSPGYINNRRLEQNTMQNLIEMIKQNYNSPAICFWSLTNELSFKYDEPATFLRQLNAKAKELDPQRLTTLAICYDQDRFQHITDVIGWNKYFGWYNAGGSIGSFMDDAHRLAGHQPIGLCEYGAAASINQHSFEQKVSNRIHYEEYQARVHEDNWMQMRERPFVWCKFIWQYADNPSSIRDEGDTRGMNDKGIVTYDRKTRKDAYYFYQANWSDTPMLYIAARRYTDRNDQLTDVKVYTNQSRATLFVNGKRVATGRNDGMGRIIFRSVSLNDGSNTIRVTAGRLADECVWTLREGGERMPAEKDGGGLDGAV